MSARLPHLSRVPLPSGRIGMLETLADEWDEADGYVLAETARADVLLFIRGGKFWCAGSFEGGRPSGIPMPQALTRLRSVTRAEMRETDLALFLCLAVLVRKAPSATLPANLVDSDKIFGTLKENGKDAVLVVQNGDAYSLAFCRGGEPVALYEAPGEIFEEDGTVADRITAYLYGSGDVDDVVVHIYDDIKLPPANDARALSELSVGYATLPPEPISEEEIDALVVVVRLGGRVVFNFPLTGDDTVVGRGEEADLVLNNLSVSRRHLVLSSVDDGIVARDLGSENGILVEGERVQEAPLVTGKPIAVGKYTLELGDAEASAEERTAPSIPISRAPGLAAEKTISIDQVGGKAVLEVNGEETVVRGLAFSIGAGARAGLKLKGLLVGDVHTVIRRGEGGFIAEHVGGLRRLLVNGEATKRAELKDGDILCIAGTEIAVRISGAS